jgi:hypothetical protein
LYCFGSLCERAGADLLAVGRLPNAVAGLNDAKSLPVLPKTTTSPRGLDVYFKAGKDFDAWLASQGYPHSVHGGVPDTSEMMYLGGDTWVRKNPIPTALGDQPPLAGQSRTEQAEPRINNEITGDARRSSAALGKMLFDMKVDYAAKQIQDFLGQSQQAAQPR